MGNNTVMNLKEIMWEGVDWTNLDQDGDKWWAFVNAVRNFRVS
jgi:hypothetical protein